MMLVRVGLLVIGLCMCCMHSVWCQRTIQHRATGLCLRDVTANTMTMTFNFNLNGDPAGTVKALNSAGTGVCTINPSDVPDLVSVIRTDSTSDVSNGCGVVRVGIDTSCTNCPVSGLQIRIANVSTNIQVPDDPPHYAAFHLGLHCLSKYLNTNLTNYMYTMNYLMMCRVATDATDAQGVATYTWTIRYTEIEGLESAGIDKVYKVTCKANSPKNEASTAIIVSAPNLEETVTPQTPEATLEVLYATSKQAVGETPVIIDERLILRLTGNFAGLSDPKPVAIGGLKTVTACTPAFDATSAYYHVMIGNTACKTGNNFSPATNFIRIETPTTDSAYQETGEFRIWKCENGDRVYFKVYFTYCSTIMEQDCINACSLTSRRRRALTDENGKEIVASVRVYDPNTEKTTYGGLYEEALIGVCVGGGILVLILVFVSCYIAIKLRRRRLTEKKQMPPAGFENKLHMQY